MNGQSGVEAAPTGPVAEALRGLRADPAAAGWVRLPFFVDGEADRIAAALDREVADGAELAPAPPDIFAALRLTPLERVKAVILGQDPYPRRGEAHGLAFSYRGTRSLPPSLKVILAELAADQGDVAGPAPGGDLTAWAEAGVLLLNTALTTRVAQSGAHLRLGWARLADEAVAAVSAGQPAVAFLLWGEVARSRAALVDRAKHLVIESGHPSPLNRGRDFPGTRPFGRADAFLEARGVGSIGWLKDPGSRPAWA